MLRIGERTWYMEPQANLSTAHGVAVPSRADFLFRPTRGAPGSPAVAVFMDGFRHHRDVTDSDSAKRTALVRAGFLQWSLTWHDLETAFGNRPDEIDSMGVGKVADDMADVQQALDRRWNSEALRSRLAEPSLTLLVRYLADPDPERWKRAVFADLFCLFDRARMLNGDLRSRFNAAVADSLPGQVGEALADLPEPLAVAGRGAWDGSPPEHAELFVALPLAAVQQGEPDAVVAVVHLHDDDSDCEATELPPGLEWRVAPVQFATIPPRRMVDHAPGRGTRHLPGVHSCGPRSYGARAARRMGQCPAPDGGCPARRR